MATVYSPNEEFHLKITRGDVGRYASCSCGDPGAPRKSLPILIRLNL